MSVVSGEGLGGEHGPPAETVKAIVFCGRGLTSRKNAVCASKVVFGIDSDRRKTNVVNDNNPVWNEEGEFKVSKSEKAVLKFKLYDGDDVVGIVKIPVNELTEERQVRPLTMEPYKKGQPQPTGELQISAFINTFKSGTSKKKSTLGSKIKKFGSNLSLADKAIENVSVYSGESKNSSKVSTMKRKILGKKRSSMGGAQSMMDLGGGSFTDSGYATLPSNYGASSNQEGGDRLSLNGSEQSSIPGSAASYERNHRKESTGNKGLGKIIKNPFSKKSGMKKSMSMFNVSDLPVESWDQKMADRLNRQAPNNDDDTGIESSPGHDELFPQPINSKHSTSFPDNLDSGFNSREGEQNISSIKANPPNFKTQTLPNPARIEKSGTPSHSRNNSSGSASPILITDIIPNRGTDNGGTKVTIIGSNFGVSKEDIRCVKIAGCDVTKSLGFLSSSKISVTTSMWNTGSGPVEIETIDGRKVASKQLFEFVRSNQLTQDAKSYQVPAPIDKPNKPTALTPSSNLVDSKRKYSYSTIGLDTVATSPVRTSPVPPAVRKSHEHVNGGISSKVGSVENVRGSKTNLYRKQSDRSNHDNAGSFQTKRELEEEVVQLKKLVDELTEKNTEMSQYVESLLCKVMEHCPEILQK